MIAKLKGLVDSVDTDSAVIDVGGVGYLVDRHVEVGALEKQLLRRIEDFAAAPFYFSLLSGSVDDHIA